MPSLRLGATLAGLARQVQASISSALDTIAPVITGSGYAAGTVSFTASEPGRVYYLVDSAAIRSAAQVKAGGGVLSGFYDAEPGANVDVIDVSSVPIGNFYVHLMLEDAALNQSAVDTALYSFV